MVVYKYELNWEAATTLELPAHFEVLDIQEQYGVPVLWALVDPDCASSMQLTIKPIFTGEHGDYWPYQYIKTLQRTDYPLVYHFFSVWHHNNYAVLLIKFTKRTRP